MHPAPTASPTVPDTAFLPVRLPAGTDLRRALEEAAAAFAPEGCFVVSGIGSLQDAQLRLAARDAPTGFDGSLGYIHTKGEGGPVEVITSFFEKPDPATIDELDDEGYVLVQPGSTATTLRGVFAAGAVVTAATRSQSLRSIDMAFLGMGAFFALVAIFIFTARKKINAASPATTQAVSPLKALSSPWAIFGALAIFLYVGSEVAIGGMLTNFESQLETAGLGDRFEELLYEVARVREELAYPIMITPFAQFVGTQAVMNVMTGERYSVVPNEIKKYALGYYGEPLAPLDPEVLEKILANGSSEITEEIPELKPVLPGLKEAHPDEDIDTLLLRVMFAGSQVDEMKRFVAEGRAGEGEGVKGGVLTSLVQQIYNSSDTTDFHLKTSDLEINLTN